MSRINNTVRLNVCLDTLLLRPMFAELGTNRLFLRSSAMETPFFNTPGRTNNNNLLTTINYNSINNCTPSDVAIGANDGLLAESQGQVLTQNALEVEDAAAKKNLINESHLPMNWEFIKLDLFDNAKGTAKQKLKLSFKVKLTGKRGWTEFKALLNSPFRHLKRNLTNEVWESKHYQNVRASYAILKSECGKASASKFYLGSGNYNGQSVEFLTVLVAPGEKDGQYVVDIHFKEENWVWLMQGGSGYLTPAQRKANIISTASVRRGKLHKNINAGDLL